jgi:hypothetical protein
MRSVLARQTTCDREFGEGASPMVVAAILKTPASYVFDEVDEGCSDQGRSSNLELLEQRTQEAEK